MCFSMTADLVAGGVVTVIGVDAWRHAAGPTQRTLAAVPTVLGAHLLVEALVWWSLEGSGPERLGTVATWAYLLVALVVVPILAPAALAAVEPPGRSRKLMAPFVALGVFTAGALFNGLLVGPVTATVEGRHIDYSTGMENGGLFVALYVAAVAGATLLSRDRWIVGFGLVNLVVVAALIWLESGALISLWCGWAAVTSIAICVRIRRANPDGTPRVPAQALPEASVT